MPQNRPNILLIHPDQLRYDCLAHNGHPLARTPNIDRLASEGVRFTKAFCPIPLCCPARQSLMSGLWPEQHGGLWNYDCTLLPPPFEADCWTEKLAESGYRMGYVGKWHVHPEKTPLDYGFGDYVSEGDYNVWRKSHNLPEPVVPGNLAMGGMDPVAPEQARPHWLANEVIRLMKNYAEGDAPWHLRLDFPEPHLPCLPVPAFWADFQAAPVEPWANFPDPLEKKPYIQKQQRVSWGLEDTGWDEWAVYVRRYLAVIAQMDDAIGKVLQALEETGQAENTLVIFTTDHGDACGSHGMMDKHYVMYEEEIHVPFIARWSGKIPANSQCDAFITPALDLAATLPEAAGITPLEQTEGLSLLPLMEGKTSDNGRSCVFGTYNGQQFGLYTTRMVRTDRYKYIWNLTDIDEFYDLEEDPAELDNRIEDASLKPTIAELRKTLLDHLVKVEDGIVRTPFVRDHLTEGRKIPLTPSPK